MINAKEAKEKTLQNVNLNVYLDKVEKGIMESVMNGRTSLMFILKEEECKMANLIKSSLEDSGYFVEVQHYFFEPLLESEAYLVISWD